MRALLDTHTLLWLVEGDARLSQNGVELLVDPGNELLLSPATYWELAIKIAIGKYRISDPLVAYVEEAIRLYQLTILPIEVRHAEAVAHLPHHHKDPFDRMLVAQCIVDQVPLISSDEAFDAYPVQRLW
ncbi:MAG: type II toxin-antitoxin system VapC family toxin [Planctomycetota bacterium]|nr:type II toxin-antitoxin system VapC family toxin [Planctomycetota bacterium]